MVDQRPLWDDDELPPVQAFRRGVRLYRKLTQDGYVLIWNPMHPLARKDGWVLEHRMVWYDAHGNLKPSETVHHINNNRQDNRLENLEPWTGNHPSGMRKRDAIRLAYDVLAEAAPASCREYLVVASEEARHHFDWLTDEWLVTVAGCYGRSEQEDYAATHGRKYTAHAFRHVDGEIVEEATWEAAIGEGPKGLWRGVPIND
jgi:hypothetical protein